MVKRMISVSAMLWLGLMTLNGFAAELKDAGDIDIATLTNETQRMNNSKNSSMQMAWWLPVEYWLASISSGGQVTPAGLIELEYSLSPYFIISVLVADVSPFGVPRFEDPSVVAANLEVEYENRDGEITRLEIEPNVDPDMKAFLNQMIPMVAGALGPIGTNLNFYTFSDRDDDGNRIVPPTEPGILRIRVSDKDQVTISNFKIEMPLDSLFVPRLCADGRPTHISWVYCPWDGKKIED